MKKYFRIISANLKAALTIKKVVFINIIFVIVFILKKESSFFNIVNLSDYVKYSFCRPNNLMENIEGLFIWSLYQIYFIYIGSSYICRELKRRNLYTISRIGNKTKWYIGMQITLLLLSLIYYITGIFVISFCAFITNKNVVFYDIKSILNILMILFLASYFFINVYMIVLLKIKNHNIALLSLILLIYLSIEFGNILNLDWIIPFNREILAKHYSPSIVFFKSYIYLILMSVANFIVIGRCILKNDLVEIVE